MFLQTADVLFEPRPLLDDVVACLSNVEVARRIDPGNGSDRADYWLRGEKTVRLHALVPILEDEMTFKLEHGFDALFDRMQERGLTELINPDRRSVLSKRFWIV